jgi:transcriptional regulator with XRE-family HTH domain
VEPQGLGLRLVRARLGLSQERFARVLDVSARSIARWEASDSAPVDPVTARRLVTVTEIVALAEEIYGADLGSFLSTPRRSLVMRTPRQAMIDGDLELVREVLVDGLEGHWA